MNRFETFKNEILKRAKDAEACKGEYKRAYMAESFSELIEVIKDNITFCIINKVIEDDLIVEYESEFEQEYVYCNTSTDKGLLLLLGNASVEASGNASVIAYDNTSVIAYDNTSVTARDNASIRAYDNASVKASGSASVRAWDNALVRVWGNATVRAWDNAYIYSHSIIDCTLTGNAIYRCGENNTIYYANEKLKLEKI